jgi:4-amino-4-deoxy-L-arabinose transferase-like glycosyltransferase
VRLLNSYRNKVIGCLLLTILVRVIWVMASWDFAPRIDNRDYLQRAVYLFHNGHFLPVVFGHHVFADAYWPPVFPVFLAALVYVHQGLHELGLLGPLHQMFSSQNYNAGPALPFIRFMRIAAGTVTAFGVLPLIWIARRIFGDRIAIISGVLYAIFPPIVYVADSLYSEALFTPLLLCSVAAAIKYRETRRWWWLLLTGVITGVAGLTHSDGLVLVLPLGVAVLVPLDATGHGSWRALRDYRSASGWWLRIRRLWPLAVLVAAALVTISPWTIRNEIDLHAFVPVSDSSGRTLAGVYNSYSAHDPDQPGAFHKQFVNVAPYRELFKKYPSPTPAQSSAQVHAAIDYVRAHPLYPLRVAYWNTVRILELTGGRGTEERAVREGINLPFAWVGDIAFWIVGIIALFGAFSGTMRRSGNRWIWLVPLTMYVAVVFINTSTPRFRDPIDPFIVLAAAVALGTWWGRRTRSERSLAPTGDPPLIQSHEQMEA